RRTSTSPRPRSGPASPSRLCTPRFAAPRAAPPPSPTSRSSIMRLGVRLREAVAVTLLTFLVVATTTLTHLSHLSLVVTREADRLAELIARQIFAPRRHAIAAAPSDDPRRVLRLGAA